MIAGSGWFVSAPLLAMHNKNYFRVRYDLWSMDQNRGWWRHVWFQKSISGQQHFLLRLEVLPLCLWILSHGLRIKQWQLYHHENGVGLSCQFSEDLNISFLFFLQLLGEQSLQAFWHFPILREIVRTRDQEWNNNHVKTQIWIKHYIPANVWNFMSMSLHWLWLKTTILIFPFSFFP